MHTKQPGQSMTLVEIESLYPDHWILIDQPILNQRKELVAGNVVFVGQRKRELHERLRELKLPGFAIHCTKKEPPFRKYL